MPDRLDIPIGRDHAITREELARIWHCSERDAHATIAAFRTNPSDDRYAVLSTSSTPAGYWRSDDPHEITTFIRETENRTRNTYRSLKDAQRVMKLIN